jgi:DNA-binding PadR family transcriptional regulator
MKASDISEREMLEAFEARRLPMDKTFAAFPEKVVYAKMDKLDRKGFIEFGLNIRWGWLTEKGKARLEELRSSSPSPPAATTP